MGYKLVVLACCIAATLALTGCNEKASEVAGFSDGSSSGAQGTMFAENSSSSSYDSGSGSSRAPHNPEPATLALVGVGLAGLGMFKLRKRK
ncbi:MAG: PEP-CTERM sorting domain-containing protein [Candidatus Omnitrophota bacterium]